MRMKGFGIEQLAPIAIIFIVAFFLFAIGSIIMEDLSEEFCDDTYFATDYCSKGVVKCNNTLVNPVTGGYFGCCEDGPNATTFDCVTWATDKTSGNISQSGSEAIEELAGWGPTLALVIIAAIIIGVLITYLARGSRV